MTICILLSLVALVISWGYEYRNCELTFLRDTVYIIEYVEIIGCSNVVRQNAYLLSDFLFMMIKYLLDDC